MANATHRKQGDEFEPQHGVKGFWIVPDETFLFRGTAPQRLMFVESATGETCIGFPVEHVAGAFKITPDELLESNRLGTLDLQVDVLPTTGEPRRFRYTFGIPAIGTTATVLRDLPVGWRA